MFALRRCIDTSSGKRNKVSRALPRIASPTMYCNSQNEATVAGDDIYNRHINRGWTLTVDDINEAGVEVGVGIADGTF